MSDNRNFNDFELIDHKLSYRNILSFPTSGCGDSAELSMQDTSISCNGKDSKSNDFEMRFVNPAIYVEPLNKNFDGQWQDDYKKLANSVIEKPCGDADELSKSFPHISLNDKPHHGLNASLSQSALSSIAPSLMSTNQTKSMTKVERRCKIDGNNDEFAKSFEGIHKLRGGRSHISTSFSTSNLSARGCSSCLSLPRQLAHEEWVQKKRLESIHSKKKAKELEARRKAEEKKLANEQMERERREQENFLMWTKIKKEEEARKRKLAEKQRELMEKLKKIEEKTAVAKKICLHQWSVKKDREQRAQKQEQEVKLKQLEQEKKRRMEESVKAFEEWRERSKNTPRPATQGLLPHQKAKPTYVNPIPWITEETPPETPTPPKNNSKLSRSIKGIRKNNY